MPTLLPTRAVFGPEAPVEIELRGAPAATAGRVAVYRLGELVHEREFAGGGILSLGALPEGAYGVEAVIDGETARTAVMVSADPRSRMRYGFVASYRPDADTSGVTDLARRLHLNAIQFYDWAYRHAELLGGGERYVDALDQPIDLGTVRRLVSALRDVGSTAHGYAAVYAVGPQEWGEWSDLALLQAGGEPYGLGDFLFLVDPAADRWAEHLEADLRRAVAEVGFEGFHLDQYGYPKYAARPDGTAVDVSASFVSLIDRLRAALPAISLVFNNVNDFPTWATGRAPQDAVYIEPWKPNSTLGSLAQIATRARLASAGQPVVLAAYQHVYDQVPAEVADRAAAFTMATLFSHGATQLLAGESGHVLVDPYYVRNHEAETGTIDMLARWYDFLVEHDALLMDPAIAEVTGSYVGDYNADLDVAFGDAVVSETATAGTVWRRVTQTPEGLVVHAINLVGQVDAEWDAARQAPASLAEGELRFRFVHGRVPRVRVAEPGIAPRLVDVPVRIEGDYACATVPAPHIWEIIHVVL